MNLCICGYYGMGNFGDELFLKTFRENFSEHNVFPWNAYIDEAKIDAVVIGGGDLITPYSFNEYYFPPRLSNHPTWVYGVGIVDYYPESQWPEEEIEKYKERLSKAKGIYLRDSNSVNIAKRLKFNSKIEEISDIAFSLKQPKYPVRRFSNKKTIGLCIYSYDDFPVMKIISMLTNLIRKDFHIVLIPVVNQTNNKFSDIGMCIKLKEAILDIFNDTTCITLPSPEYDLEVTYNYLTSVDFLISFKLHPALTALRNGVPTFCLSKMGKVKSLLEYLKIKDFYSDFDLPSEQIQKKIDDFLELGTSRMKEVHPIINALEQEGKLSLLKLKKEIEKTIGEGM